MKTSKVRTLVVAALLLAAHVVLVRFCAITTPLVRISFGFLPLAICGMLYGPVWAGVVGGLADLLGATLFPAGPFFPGFTLSTALTGVIFGLLLRRERAGPARVALAVALDCLVVSLCLNTLWLSIMGGTPFLARLPFRMVTLIMVPIEFILLRAIEQPVRRYLSGVRQA